MKVAHRKKCKRDTRMNAVMLPSRVTGFLLCISVFFVDGLGRGAQRPERENSERRLIPACAGMTGKHAKIAAQGFMSPDVIPAKAGPVSFVRVPARPAFGTRVFYSTL